LRDRPEFRVDDGRLIDTGAIAARRATALGFEMAVQARRFSAQGEDLRTGGRRRDAEHPGPSFQGWYRQGA